MRRVQLVSFAAVVVALAAASPVHAQTGSSATNIGPMSADTIGQLGAELAAAKQQVAQLQVSLKALQVQHDALARTLDTLLQGDADRASQALTKDQQELGKRLVIALGGDPEKDTFDFTTKAIKKPDAAKKPEGSPAPAPPAKDTKPKS